MKRPLRGLIATVIPMTLGSLAALPASASSLPSSTQPATGEWTVMRPSSFPGTIASAVEQCERDAALRTDDLFTRQHCIRFRTMLTGNECREVMVPDGIVHDHMNAYRARVTHNVVKKTGRLDRALLCNLGGGVFGYWYTGVKGQSCNNVAISIVVPRLTYAPPPPPPLPKKKVCRSVAVVQYAPVNQYVYLPGYVLPEYCPPGVTFVPSMLLNNGAGPDKSTTFIEVCE